MGPSTGLVTAVATAATVGALLLASAFFLRPSGGRPKLFVARGSADGAEGRAAGVADGAAVADGNAAAATPAAKGATATAVTNGAKADGASGAVANVVAVATSDAEPLSKESQELAALYRKMAEDFAANDLNSAAIGPLRSWFHGTEEPDDTPWPKKYGEMDEPLQFGAVRLLVVPLDDSPAVLRVAAAVTADVMRLLPHGTKVFANARGNYHCTVFHTSQPTDPRPDPSRPDGGLGGPDGAALRPSLRRLQSPAEWAAELETVRRLVAATPVPVLRFERVVMASSGVLLLTWTEAAQGQAQGPISDLRRRLREAFPGAPAKQATIIHSSLLRVVSPHPLGPAAVAALSAACDAWTSRLRGSLTYSPRSLWFVRETEFSTVVGEREVLTLADPAAPVRHF